VHSSTACRLLGFQVFHNLFLLLTLIFREYQCNLSIVDPVISPFGESRVFNRAVLHARRTDDCSLLSWAGAPKAQLQVSLRTPHFHVMFSLFNRRGAA
jgi:hypothetical protein